MLPIFPAVPLASLHWILIYLHKLGASCGPSSSSIHSFPTGTVAEEEREGVWKEILLCLPPSNSAHCSNSFQDYPPARRRNHQLLAQELSLPPSYPQLIPPPRHRLHQTPDPIFLLRTIDNLLRIVTTKKDSYHVYLKRENIFFVCGADRRRYVQVTQAIWARHRLINWQLNWRMWRELWTSCRRTCKKSICYPTVGICSHLCHLSLTSAERDALLETLKIYGRDPTNSDPIFTKEAGCTRPSIPSTSTDSHRESKFWLAMPSTALLRRPHELRYDALRMPSSFERIRGKYLWIWDTSRKRATS